MKKIDSTSQVDIDYYFMDLAGYIAKLSDDRSTQCGCVIVGPDGNIKSAASNKFCDGINPHLDERHERPEKYLWIEHAERNAIYLAAKEGSRLEGSTLYLNSPVDLCADCARAIIQSGIKRVVINEYVVYTEKWSESFKRSQEMFNEKGIVIDYLKPNKNGKM